jgi:hypothetical protein
MEIGYWLSSAEHPPDDLVRYAQQAEAVGFTLQASLNFISGR